VLYVLYYRLIISKKMATIKKVSFIGLGNMGYSMAMNLMKKGGYVVRGFDVSSQTLDKFKSDGGSIMKTPQDCEDSDAIVTMLPSNPHVLSTYLDQKNGVIHSKDIRPGTILIDSSTVNPAVSKTVYEAAKEKKMTFVDAPVSGGVNGAKAGTLTFMVVSSL
jgi:3-hydroxyisobutyrate dehydrogenase